MPADAHTAAAHDLIVLGRSLAGVAVSIGVRAGALHGAGLDDTGPAVVGHVQGLRDQAALVREAAAQLDGIADGLDQ